MAVQTVNGYAFNVKRVSLTPAQTPSNAGMGGYEGDEVFVIAANANNALAVLQQWYGTDLGTVSGGASIVYGALTTMTGS
jgi:hypothetical protein